MWGSAAYYTWTDDVQPRVFLTLGTINKDYYIYIEREMLCTFGVTLEVIKEPRDKSLELAG